VNTNCLAIISDTHTGCGMALCHPDGLKTDEGTVVMPSPLQLKLWDMWRSFFDDWLPEATDGEPYDLVHNGDAIDGTHHKSVTQMTHNLVYQRRHAEMILGPEAKKAKNYYHIRGTEAHVGVSAMEEETLAESLGAVPTEYSGTKQYARYELWKRVGGKRGGLVHIMHHIGTAGSSAYESSAVMRELSEAFVEAGRWNDEPPRVIVRAHRHRHIQIRMPAADGDAIGVVTPAWQLKTPFTYRIAGARQTQPQIGGIVIRYHKGELYARSKVWRVERPKEE